MVFFKKKWKENSRKMPSPGKIHATSMGNFKPRPCIERERERFHNAIPIRLNEPAPLTADEEWFAPIPLVRPSLGRRNSIEKCSLSVRLQTNTCKGLLLQYSKLITFVRTPLHLCLSTWRAICPTCFPMASRYYVCPIILLKRKELSSEISALKTKLKVRVYL